MLVERRKTHGIILFSVFHTLLFSVATVARILLAERRTIFSLIKPKETARG